MRVLSQANHAAAESAVRSLQGSGRRCRINICSTSGVPAVGRQHQQCPYNRDQAGSLLSAKPASGFSAAISLDLSDALDCCAASDTELQALLPHLTALTAVTAMTPHRRPAEAKSLELLTHLKNLQVLR